MRHMLNVMQAALLLTACLVAAGCSQPRPEEVAVSFIEAVAEGKYDRALALIDVPEKVRQDQQRWENDKGKITSMLAHAREKFDDKGGVSGIEVVDSIYQKPDRQGRECLQVRLKVITREGEPTVDKVNLVLDGRQWRISM